MKIRNGLLWLTLVVGAIGAGCSSSGGEEAGAGGVPGYIWQGQGGDAAASGSSGAGGSSGTGGSAGVSGVTVVAGSGGTTDVDGSTPGDATAGGSGGTGGSGGAGGAGGVVLTDGSIGPGPDGATPSSARQRYSIDALAWKFKKGDFPGAEQPVYADTDWLGVKIPHDFNGGIDGVNNDVFTGPKMYRGPGWYRVHFSIDQAYASKRIWLDFEGVSMVADVWLNGQPLGQHKGGFTGFSFDATSNIKFGADNVLVVKANSANDPKVAPWMQVPFGAYPTSYDYALYGGIYRDVFVTITDAVSIKRTLVSTPGVSAATSKVNVKTDVLNSGTAAASVSLKTDIKDAAGQVVGTMTDTKSVDPAATVTFDQTSAAIATPHLWSPDDPYLYKVVSTISVGANAVDGIDSPLGFRWFTTPTAGAAFTLNGNATLLRGVNQHQDRKGFGWALTDDQHREDIAWIKKAGFNAIRSSHYPVDPSYMDEADRLGLLLWVEIPVTVGMSTDPDFLANAKSQLTEMIGQAYNHPSVFIWGIGNESDQNVGAAGLTEAYTNQVYGALNTLSKQLDATRPTTGCNFKYASNQKLVDAYSPQDWAGWYGGVYTSYNPSGLIGEYGADCHVTVHQEPAAATQWSQEYACKLHEYFIAQGEAKKASFPGHFSYLMFDFASARQDRSTNPIPYMNQKGLLLADRTPKDVFYLYQSMFTDKTKAPMVYIVSHTWLNRWTAPGAKTVWAYSNCDEVELFNGTTSLGIKTRTAGEHATVKTRFQWDNAMVSNNLLKADCRVGGAVKATDSITLQNLPAP